MTRVFESFRIQVDPGTVDRGNTNLSGEAKIATMKKLQ